ncbi:MAG TPA: SgcJ/EcaC family oxidoreductase [Gemmataceae bacterium]|jgi:uncharacterized protein (TIGR02246 family)|nr:SgcJ/EcaC family oxidoreductase [Gemmataceae bacterium]
MKTRLLLWLAAPALLFGLTALLGAAKHTKADSQDDDAAITKNRLAFVKAFHSGDAEALAALWTPDGDYMDESGRDLKGRAAIEKAFTAFFAENKGLKLRIDIGSVRFVTPEVAIEDGTTDVIPPGGAPPNRTRYSIVHVKKDGQWQLASVRDAHFTPETNYEHLRGLEWVVGEWADAGETGQTAHLSFTWSDNQNFLVNTFATTFKDITLASGTQWIGWDPNAKHLRSWTFDAHGGFGEATWARDGDNWVIKAHSVLRDGKKVTETNTVTRVDADTLTWTSRDRTVDGKRRPDIKAIKMKRVQ